MQSGPKVDIQRMLYYILYIYFWPTLYVYYIELHVSICLGLYFLIPTVNNSNNNNKS